MKKFYRISILLITLIFLSTFVPNKFDQSVKKKSNFFKVEIIEITGNFLIDKNEVEEKLIKIYNKNIFLIKKRDIQHPLKKINFFKQAIVKKKYPNKIVIQIFETQPVAILFRDESKYLLDNLSNLILFEENKKFTYLPSIFGNDAEKNFIIFFNLLKKNNFPQKKIKEYYFFPAGRWDVHLSNNKVIKFPSDNIERSIKKSIELLDSEDFANYKIIDLRINDKIIVE